MVAALTAGRRNPGSVRRHAREAWTIWQRMREDRMYMVYWTIVEQGAVTPHQQPFDTSEMVQAMRFMEELRRRQRAGEGVRFVTMCSEHPDVVGHPGVDVTGPGYNWKKRRR
jgi:hypothetical protein